MEETTLGKVGAYLAIIMCILCTFIGNYLLVSTSARRRVLHVLSTETIAVRSHVMHITRPGDGV